MRTVKIKVSERAHQEVVIAWAEYKIRKWPCLKWLYSNRNEATSIGERVKGKKMGIKAGVFDLFLPHRAPNPRCMPGQDRTYFSGLYIEMKTEKKKPSEVQLEFGDFVRSEGYRAEIAWSADEAIKIIENYLLEV